MPRHNNSLRYAESKKALTLDRAMEVYRLRVTEQLTYAEIAQRLSISEATAFKDYGKANQIVLSKYADKGDKVRGKYARKLDALLESLEDKALAGDLDAVAEARKLIHQLCQLYGAYPQVQTELTINMTEFRLMWGSESTPALNPPNVIEGHKVEDSE